MGVFGQSQTGPVSPENPLGLKGAPEEQANQGEPQNNVAGNGNDVQEQQVQEEQQNVGENQPQEQDNESKQAEQQPEKITTNDDYERKINFLRQKFDGPEDFEKSTVELANKLGKEIPDSFDSQEQLIDYYIQLEEEQGRQGQQQQQQQGPQDNQLSQIQQENQRLRAALQRMMLEQQQGQQQARPQRDPNTGKFVSQQKQQQEQGQNVDDMDFGDIDVDEFMSEFYEKGPNAENFKKVLKNAAGQIAEQKVKEYLQEQQKQQQKQQQAKLIGQHLHKQAEQIKQQYGEQEFEKYKQDMQREFRKYPFYLNPNLFPNGFQRVFESIRSRKQSYQQQQNNIQQQNQANNAQKKAARMPGSQGNARFKINQEQQNMTPEQRIKQQIFQEQPNKQGVFG